jgi:hypothetical protein
MIKNISKAFFIAYYRETFVNHKLVNYKDFDMFAYHIEGCYRWLIRKP